MAIQRTAEIPSIPAPKPDMILPLACYIAGCLASQRLLYEAPDLNDFFDTVEMATRIIAKCLENNPIEDEGWVHIDEMEAEK